MSLPKVDVPVYELKVPSTGKKIRYRPYLVKEELILMMAAESQEAKEIVAATKQIVHNCVLEPANFDVETLTTFDLDYIFCALRARSVGDEVQVVTECNRIVEDTRFPLDQGGKGPCGHQQTVKISLNNLTVVRPDESKKTKIMLGKDFGVELKYPSFRTIEKVNALDNEIDKQMKVIEGCISSIFDKDQIYSLDSGESTPAEIRTWIESLTTDQFAKIKTFCENTPYLVLKVAYKCEKCGFNHTIEKRNVLDFF
jgi:hypothetical protein